MSNVTMTFTVQQANFISGVMKMQAAMDKTDRGFKKAGKSLSTTQKAFNSFGKTMAGVAGGFLGAQGIRMAVGATVAEFKKLSETTVQFEKDMGGLLSLGDNLSRIGEKKGGVLELSSAFGKTREEAARMFFDIQSGASHFSTALQKEIRTSTLGLVDLTNAPLVESNKMLLKSMLIYGDQLKDPTDAMNKLFKTAELGFMTVEDLANLFPDLASVAKPLGHSIDEVGAALVVATQLGGNNEKTFTGLRNAYLKMNDAIKAGYTTRKSFVEQLKDLSKMDAFKLTEVFGARSATAMFGLVENVERLPGLIAEIGGQEGNLVLEKLGLRRQDINFIYSQVLPALTQLQENLRVLGSTQYRDLGAAKLRKEAAKAAIIAKHPAIPDWIAGTMGWAAAASPLPADKKTIAQGAGIMQEAATAAGKDPEMAKEDAIFTKGGPAALAKYRQTKKLTAAAPNLTNSIEGANAEIERLRNVQKSFRTIGPAKAAGAARAMQEINETILDLKAKGAPPAILKYISASVRQGDDAGVKAFMEQVQGPTLTAGVPTGQDPFRTVLGDPLKAIAGGKRKIPEEEVEKKREAAFMRASGPLRLGIIQNEQRAVQYEKGDERRKFYEGEAGKLGDELKVIEAIRETNKILSEIAAATKQPASAQTTMSPAPMGAMP